MGTTRTDPRTDWLDVDEHPPETVGWYATVLCWDAQEGLIPRAEYWDGSHWVGDRPVVQRSPETFTSEPEAHAWAYAHDPEP